MSLVSDTGILGGRAVTRSARNPASIMGAVIFPLLFFALFSLVMSRIMEARGFDYTQLLPSAIVVQALLFAAMSSAYYVTADRISGFSARLRSMTVNRAAPMLGSAVGVAARATLSMVLVLAVGLAAGMRFEAGWIWLPAYLGVALLFVLAAGSAFSLFGQIASTPDAAVSLSSMLYLPLLMLSSAFAPVDDFPDWLQPFVEWQPVSLTISALRALTGQGDIGADVLLSLGASLGLIVVFGAIGARLAGRPS